ncbi:MAG: hypothetical protein PHX47_00925 [Candidatus ainarchaeum sp.]|jgi:histone H3/H4|nr:hypothetical protein [Candidatus ainarchaeum sp.]
MSEVEKQINDQEVLENKDASLVDDEDETLDEDDEKLPFPNARVVRLMRESLDQNKQIKSVVKKEMNIFLGRIVETICKKMNEFDYSYVDYGMFKQAIETFENIQTIELEKIRIIKALEKIKADCDVLVNDVERKFHE